MAFLSRSHLLGLLLLVALPPEGTAALAVAAARAAVPSPTEQPASLEERLRRIEAAVRARDPNAATATEANAEGAAPRPADPELAFTFVNGPGLGWGNGGFRNGGFYNGGFRNGGFYNGGFRNGGFANGGGWRNGGWRIGGGGWRNGGFRNHW
jgi:rSAM-associated Gly-rich repeat protein